MSRTADVVVIGGGVMGVSIAFALALKKAGRVVLVEKSFVGAGSSGKSGAIIRQHYSHPLLVKMTGRGLEYFRRFPEIVGGPPVFTHSGMLVIVPADGRAQLEANLAMQRGLGVEAAMIGREEFRTIDPRAELGENEVAAYERTAGYCDAVQAVGSWAAACERVGVSLEQGVAVESIGVENGRVRRVGTSAGAISCGNVVIAAGPWAARVGSMAGAALAVRSCRAQVSWLRRAAEFGGAHPVYADSTNQIYAREVPGGVMHVGNIDAREEAAEVDPESYGEAADEGFVAEMKRKIAARCPAMRNAVSRGGYGALYAITPDWQPILDRLGEVEGGFAAVGFSGHGFKLAPAVGEVMAEWVVEGKPRSFDVSPLALARFAEGRLLSAGTGSKIMG